MPPVGFRHSKESKEKMRGKRPHVHAWNYGTRGLVKAWNKGLTGEQSHMWKGEKVGYVGIHTRLKRKYAPARFFPCMMCNGKRQKGRIEWANISGEYKQEDSDWLTLCLGCHRQFELLTGRRKRAKDGTWYWRKKYGKTKLYEKNDLCLTCDFSGAPSALS